MLRSLSEHWVEALIGDWGLEKFEIKAEAQHHGLTAETGTSGHAFLDEYLKPPLQLSLVKSPAEELSGSEKIKPKTAAASERVIELSDVDKSIGWWQKKEYASLGVERIRLGQDSVALEFKEPIKKSVAFIISLEFAKTASFHFSKSGDSWVMKDVHGLKVEGQAVNKVECAGNSISFYTDKGNKLDYGKAVTNFTRALFDPLMEERLRK